MHRHQRPATSRVWLGTFVVSLALSLMFVSSPAQASPDPVAAPAAAAPEIPTTATRTLRPVPQFSEGGCGFLQRCLYFSRSEQLIILAGGSATIVAAICGATALLGCAAASGLVGAAFQWLSSRGGACPTSKPKLKVRYLPWPAVQGCVA